MKSLNSSLVKFHASLKPIAKDAQNPFFKSDYLTLSGILDAVRLLLASVDLALIQAMRVEGEKTILVTKIIHSSGEEIFSEMILPNNQDPQKLGSLITYYKRYQLQAILGISTAEEDDDGNSVSTAPFKAEPKGPQKPEHSRPMAGLASDAQKNALRNMKIEFDNTITKQEASELIAKNSKRN